MAVPFQDSQGAGPNEQGYTPKGGKPSNREIRKFQRQQRRADRRASRFRKESDSDAKAAAEKVASMRGSAGTPENPSPGSTEDGNTKQEDPQGSDISYQSLTSEQFWVKSDGMGTLTSMGIDANGKRHKPGFTPNELYWHNTFGWYLPEDQGVAPNGWWGNLLDAHYSRISGSNNSSKRGPQTFMVDFDHKLGGPDLKPDKSRKPKANNLLGARDEQGQLIFGNLPYSKRETLLMHNDTATDYFLHDTILNKKTRGVRDDENADMVGRTLLYSSKGTGWENQDPVVYGFEVIIDALSSPLLNGSVEEFIKMYPRVSEIQSRRRALFDFKKQFQKLFKTRGQINFNQEDVDLYQNEALYSDYQYNDLATYANQPNPQGSNTFWRGKKAYLSHYLYKIEGLHKLNVSSLGETKKYINDWGKDFIKLTFREDVSGTMAALMQLYNLLYWSKPNGKGIVPENLLRFNCEIIVSEVRNFNRVSHAVDEKNLQVLKDNVSRYRYSLRECQFYFDTPSHEDAIDYTSNQAYDGFVVNFDYKYSFLKYEKWVSDPNKFGQYVAYNNGSIWRLGNKGARQQRQQEDSAEGGGTGNIVDTSNPRFYTRGTNSLGQDGVKQAIELNNYQYIPIEEPLPIGNTLDNKNKFRFNFEGYDDPEQIGFASEEYPPGLISVPLPLNKDEDDVDEGKFKRRVQSSLEKFKQKSKQTAKRILKESYMVPWREIKAQVGIRAQLLLDTVDKMKNLVGLGGLDTDPINVYPRPYTPIGMGIFFDVRNELYNYWAEEISAIQSGLSSIINPFNSPGIEGILPDKLKKANAPSVWFNPLNQLLKKFSGLPSVMQSSINDGMMQDMKASFSTLGLGKNQPASGGSLIDILNDAANFKPKSEGDGTAGSYTALDPQLPVEGTNYPGGGQPKSFGIDSSVKSSSSLEAILNANANFKPSDEGDGTANSYKAFDPQEPKTGTNYPGGGQPKGFGPDTSQKSTDTLKSILNTNANFKPKDEDPNSYIVYDPQNPKIGTNYPGGGQPKSFGIDSSVKSSSSLEGILNTNANFKPSDEGDGTAGSYTAYDPQEPKTGTNYPGGGQPKSFGPDTSKKSTDTLKSILNASANFKPKDEDPNSYIAYDPQEPKTGTNYPQGGQPKSFGIDSSVKSSSSLEGILNTNANFKPSEEGGGVPGAYTAFDPQNPKQGTNYPTPGSAKGFGGLYGQGVKAQASLESILNSFATFKPIDEGVSKNKVIGVYKPYDPNVGFGGASVTPSSDNVKSQGSLENIVKNNTIWPYPVNNKKFGS